MKYPYLTASLPVLIHGDEPPESPEKFLFHCTGALEAGDLRELEAVLHNQADECRTRAASRWFDLETQLRNTVAEIRAKRLGVDPRGFTEPQRHFDVWTRHGIDEAFAKPDPLEREEALDQIRWRWLDELALEDPHGFGAVVAHALKLRLMTRWAGLAEETGRRILDQTLEALLQSPSAVSS